MALHWEWKNNCGELTVEQFREDMNETRTFTMSLYRGNAFLIMLHEYIDKDGRDVYDMYGFFADKQHAKNCLGLNKKEGYTQNIYNEDWSKWTKIKLNKAKYDYAKDLVPMLVQAFDNITIEIVNEPDKGGK